MKNEKHSELWQELTEAEATECAGGIVTTGPVRTLDLVQLIASGPFGFNPFVAAGASVPAS